MICSMLQKGCRPGRQASQLAEPIIFIATKVGRTICNKVAICSMEHVFIVQDESRKTSFVISEWQSSDRSSFFRPII